MGIRKRGDKWLVTAESGRDEFGVRRRVCRAVDTEDEAKRLDAKLQHEVYEGKHVKPSSESVPDFCQRYLEDHRDAIAPNTHARYAEILESNVRRDLGRVTLAKFTPQVGARWKADQLKAGLAPATISKHLIFVAAAMDLAVGWGLIARNPMDRVELPEEKAPPFHVYTATEQAALIAAAAPSEGDPAGHHAGRSEGSLYVPVALDLGTGLRRGELLGLRAADVDLKKGRVHVRHALRKGRDGRVEMGPCKTDRSRRSVVIPASLVELHARYIAERPKTRSSVLLLNLAARPFTLGGFESSWQKVRARAAAIICKDAMELHDPYWEQAGDKIAKARFHDLRHTHATELLRAGVHIKVVAERLGDSETTVMKTYSHVLPDMQETAAAAIEPMLRGLLG